MGSATTGRFAGCFWRARFLALGQRAAESLPSPDDPPIAPYPLITFVHEAAESRRHRSDP
jgi:hypothetical protein